MVCHSVICKTGDDVTLGRGRGRGKELQSKSTLLKSRTFFLFHLLNMTTLMVEPYGFHRMYAQESSVQWVMHRHYCWDALKSCVIMVTVFRAVLYRSEQKDMTWFVHSWEKLNTVFKVLKVQKLQLLKQHFWREEEFRNGLNSLLLEDIYYFFRDTLRQIYYFSSLSSFHPHRILLSVFPF